MKILQYKVPVVGYWMTIQTDIPDDKWAELWASWCWKTSSPIRLVDMDTGLAEREFHPAKDRSR